MGVVRIPIGHVPVETTQNDVSFTFRVEHDPLEYNYCHCEIRAYRNGVRLPKQEADALKGPAAKAWKAAKKWYRTQLHNSVRQRAIRVVLRPEVATRDARG